MKCNCSHSEYSHTNDWCASPGCHCKKFSPEYTSPQPFPLPGKENVNEWLVGFIKERSKMGEIKYGTPLFTNNGRDAMVDLLQELGDAAVYMSQLILEFAEEGADTFFLENELEKMISLIVRMKKMHERGIDSFKRTRPRGDVADYTHEDFTEGD